MINIDNPTSKFGADVEAVLKASRDISALSYMQALRRKEELTPTIREPLSRRLMLSPRLLCRHLHKNWD